MPLSKFQYSDEFDVLDRLGDTNALSDGTGVVALDNGGFAILATTGGGTTAQRFIVTVYDPLGRQVATTVPSQPLPDGTFTRAEFQPPEIVSTPTGFLVAASLSGSVSQDGRLLIQGFDFEGNTLTTQILTAGPARDITGDGFDPDDVEPGDLFFGAYNMTRLPNGSVALIYEDDVVEGGISPNFFDDLSARVISESGVVSFRSFIRLDPDDDIRSAGGIDDVSSTTLANGDIVSVFIERRGGFTNNNNLTFEINDIRAAPTPFGAFTGVSEINEGRVVNSAPIFDPEVIALETGGFAVAWSQRDFVFAGDTALRFRIYDANGQPMGFARTVDNEITGSAKLAPILDGGLAIAYEDVTVGRITLETFDGQGRPQERVTVVDSPTAKDLDIATTSDGRVVVSYLDGDAAYATIFDFRGDLIEGRQIPVLPPSVPDVLTAPNDSDPIMSGLQGATVVGFAGPDTLFGGLGDDTLDGGPGNDTLAGGSGDDSLLGGEAFVFSSPGGSAVLERGGDDVLTGGAGADTLVGSTGNDRLNGDYDQASASAIEALDWVQGPDGGSFYAVVSPLNRVTWDEADARAKALGNGIHLVAITSAEENLFVSSIAPALGAWIGGAQERTAREPGTGFGWTSQEPFTFENWVFEEPDNGLGIGPDQDVIELGTTSDAEGREWIDEPRDRTNSAYILEFAADGDVLRGGDGNDSISGQFGDDGIEGGNGLDNIAGGPGNDVIFGDGPLTSDPGSDLIFGNDGDDFIVGGGGRDGLIGGPGRDTFSYLRGDAPPPIPTSADPNERTRETIFDFVIGEDRIDLRGVDLSLLEDVEILQSNATSVVIRFADNQVQLINFDDGDQILSTDNFIFESLVRIGTAGNDNLVGGDGDDRLEGLAGNDTLYGRFGVDTIDGGSGTDVAIVLDLGGATFNGDEVDVGNIRVDGGSASGELFTRDGIKTLIDVEVLEIANTGFSTFLLLPGLSLQAIRDVAAPGDDLFVTVADKSVEITASNTAPVAVGDSGAGFSVDAGGAITTPDLLANDVDIDGDTLTISAFDTTGTLGRVTDNGDGTVDYDPNGAFDSLRAGENAFDTFGYTASDGNGGTDTGTTTVTVTGGNDAPIAVADDGYVIDAGTRLTVAADAGVLANDTDPEADRLTVTLVSDVANGTLTLADDGGFTYTPDAGFVGTDGFTYRASDGELASDVATVTIDVETGPTLVDVAVGDAPERFSRLDPTAWQDSWIDERVTLSHRPDATSAWTPVDLGTRNPGQLEGSDLWRGDLGVSGRTLVSETVPQEIDGTEALRVDFVGFLASEVSFTLAAFESEDTVHDAARVLFLDGDDAVVEEAHVDAGMGTDFTVEDLVDVAAVVFQAGARNAEDMLVPGALSDGAKATDDRASGFLIDSLEATGQDILIS